MVSYRYTAQDPQGNRVDGNVDAATVEEARSRLEQEGYRVLDLQEVAAPSSAAMPEKRLSANEAEAFAENVAQLSTAGLPLSAGLRAAGDESDSQRLAQAFYFLADELDQGRPLEDVLKSSQGFLPGYVRRLIHAAAETAEMGAALTELVEHYHDTNALGWNIWRGLAYPFLVAGMAMAVLFLILVFVVSGFEQIFVDFGAELPVLTQVLFWWRPIVLWLLPTVPLALGAAAALMRWRWGSAGWHRWLARAPVIGPLWHWLGLLEWIGLLRVLIRHGVTLLEALRLSADGVSNGNVSRISLAMAEGIARGRSLSQMIALERQVPASLVPLVRLGEESDGLADSLDMGREMLEERVRMRSLWLHTALPPILFVAIGCFILLVVGALLLPLFSLVSCLA